jgi:hypothetical protein
MKYLYLILLTSLIACSKEKTDPNAIEVSASAIIVENKYWALSIYSQKELNCTGTASVEWEVYNDQNAFMYKKSASIDFTFTNSHNSPYVKTAVQGTISMTGKFCKIKSISSTGGYKFKY